MRGIILQTPNEEGAEGCVPGIRAGIPLQLMVKTMVRACCGSAAHGEAKIHLQPVKNPMLEQAAGRTCGPMEK